MKKIMLLKETTNMVEEKMVVKKNPKDPREFPKNNKGSRKTMLPDYAKPNKTVLGKDI